MAMRKKAASFDFKPFSPRQRELITWWQEGSETAACDIVVADGAIRSGKTIAMITGFLWWSLLEAYGGNFIIAGRSMGALKRNVIAPLLQIVSAWGIPADYNRSDNVITIGANAYYLFGASNERSQDVLQGLTATGAYADEIALFPQNFCDQMIARCTPADARIWLNCNPRGPAHWFKKDYVDQAEEKHIAYLKFELDDNLTLSEETKSRYKRLYTGVFYDRYIRGLWVAAEGAIYRPLIEAPERYVIDEVPEGLAYATIGVDFGGNKSGHAFNMTAYARDFSQVVTVKDYWRDGIIDPETLAQEFVRFVRDCQDYKIPILEVRADSNEQVLIAGLQQALINAGLAYEVKNSIKGPIIDRIRLYNGLLAQERWKILRGCEATLDAFQTALYDEKEQDDVRLDDGTTVIDPIDAQEYATEPFQEAIMAWGYKNDRPLVEKARLSPGRAV